MDAGWSECQELGRPSCGGKKVPLTWTFVEERVTGIEPAFSAWEADVLPLNYTREPVEILANPQVRGLRLADRPPRLRARDLGVTFT